MKNQPLAVTASAERWSTAGTKSFLGGRKIVMAFECIRKSENMSLEAKCSCRYCNGHIAFPPEMAGQMFKCPHCGMETLLFIPPDPTSLLSQAGQEQTSETKKTTRAFFLLLAVIVLIFVPVIFFIENITKNKAPEEMHSTSQATIRVVESVTGAFGWKLGERLPDNFSVTQDKDFTLAYTFDPTNPIPSFQVYQLKLTRDRRICEISAFGMKSGEEDLSEWRSLVDRLDAALDEKYRRSEKIKSKLDDYRVTIFYYGGNDRQVRLEAWSDSPSISLDYKDSNLCDLAAKEASEAKKDADEASKKSLRNSGL